MSNEIRAYDAGYKQGVKDTEAKIISLVDANELSKYLNDLFERAEGESSAV